MKTWDLPERSSVEHQGHGFVYVSKWVRGGPCESFVLDVTTWPPVSHPRASTWWARNAARSPGGRWIVQAMERTVEQLTFRLEHYASDDAAEPFRVEEVPLPPTDFSRAPDDLSDFDLRETCRIKEAVMVGERPLLVPYFYGIDDRKPLLWSPDTGSWHPVDLPAPRRLSTVGGALADGTPVLVWDDGFYELTAGDRFAKWPGIELDGGPYDVAPIPVGRDGCYVSDDGQIRELSRSSVTRHLEGIWIAEAIAGPDGTLVCRDNHRTWVFDPKRSTVRLIPEEWLPELLHLVHASSQGLVVSRSKAGVRSMVLIDGEAIRSLPEREPQVLAPAPRTAEEAMKDGLPASRSLVATAGDRIAIAVRACVEHHRKDATDRVHHLGASLIGVAALDGRLAALDETGVIHVEEHGTYRPLGVVAPRPRSLVGVEGHGWVIVTADGITIVQDDAPEHHAFAGALAVAGSGRRVLVVSEHGTAAMLDDGRLQPAPSPPDVVHALASGPDGTWFALDPEGLLQFDGQTWARRLELDRPGDFVMPGPGPDQITVCTGNHAVNVYALPDLGAVMGVVYAGSFLPVTSPQPQKLWFVGLAAYGTGGLVVGLPGGNANILFVDGGEALRLDPFPGRDADHWLFFFGGDVLVG